MAHLLTGSGLFFFGGKGLYYFCSSLYNLDINLCSKVQLAKIFSHSLGGLLIFWKLFFFLQNSSLTWFINSWGYFLCN